MKPGHNYNVAPKGYQGTTREAEHAQNQKVVSPTTEHPKECIHGEPLGECIKNSNCPPSGTPWTRPLHESKELSRAYNTLSGLLGHTHIDGGTRMTLADVMKDLGQFARKEGFKL